MKKYIEAIEDTGGKPMDYKGDFIKEEIISKETISTIKGKLTKEVSFSKTAETSALNKVKSKEKSAKTYKRRIHYCNHEEGQPCTVEEII